MIEDGKKVQAIHNRCWNCSTCWFGCNGAIPCCTTDERQSYYSGKLFSFTTHLPMSRNQRLDLFKRMDADVDCLRDDLETMDYSLLLGVLEINLAKVNSKDITREESTALATATYVSAVEAKDGMPAKVICYFMGIIDFLQEWTTTKKIAHCIKWCFAPKPISTVPPLQYADQFLDYFNGKFTKGAEAFHVFRRVTVTSEEMKLCGEFLKLLDKDKNGTIEISEAMQALPKSLEPEIFLKHVDINNDQKVSLDEVITWFKGLKQRGNGVREW